MSSPHAGDRIEQSETIERAGRMVGDNHQRAMFGDLFEVMRRNSATDVEMFEDLFDRIQSFQVTMAGGKLLELFFIQKLFQHLFLPGGGPRLRPQVIENVVETKHSDSSSVLPRQ